MEAVLIKKGKTIMIPSFVFLLLLYHLPAFLVNNLPTVMEDGPNHNETLVSDSGQD